MRSVADVLRVETAPGVARLTPAERVALALRLGDDDIALYRVACGVSQVEARAALGRSRAIGRRRSPSNDAGPL
jgi:hypothetical protein